MNQTEAFEKWADSKEANRVTADHQHLISVREIARKAWEASAEYTREVCARVAEQAGWDSLAEKQHGKYIAERIRDGDKGIGKRE